MKEDDIMCALTKENQAMAKKSDSDKNRMELIPPYAIMALGTILTDGAKKYGDRNWENGMEWSRAYGATQRHLNAWWSGQDKDTESGHSHLWHALCEIVFLVCYEKWYKNHDDRPKGKE